MKSSLIELEDNNSSNYDDKCMQIIFNSNNNLPLKQELEILDVVTIIRSVFFYNNKYYPQVFLDECLYKLAE